MDQYNNENSENQNRMDYVPNQQFSIGGEPLPNIEPEVVSEIPDIPDDKKPKKKSFGKRIALLIASAAVFGVVAGACYQGVMYFTNKSNDNGTTGVNQETVANEEKTGIQIATTKVTDGITSQDSDVSQVFDNTLPSIVAITSTITQTTQDFFGQIYERDAEGSGSGIIVGKNENELLIVTNNHVIADSNAIKVAFVDGEVVSGKIKGTDSSADLAIVSVNVSDIKAATLKQIKIATLGNSEDVKVGETAIAIGNALGYGQSLTVGHISAKDRVVQLEDNTMTLLQTDAAINGGNSGGALLNSKGEVIGINTVKYVDSAVEGMGFAIPISKAMPIIEDLMSREEVKEGEQGYLGIQGADVSQEAKQIYGMPSGAYVKEVSKDSPAEKGGIKQGDIITKVNNMEVDSMVSLKEKINSYKAGTEVTITVMRNTGNEYKEVEIKVTLTRLDKLNS